MIESESGTNSITTSEQSLFTPLAFPGGAYNEAFSASGRPREHWQQLIGALQGRGASALHKVHLRAQQMRHDDGATINPFDDPARRSTSWDLDPVPMVISAAQWHDIEAGLIQRAQLLEQILADIYGPQKLLKSGQLPVELVFANPNFLYSCHNIRPAGKRFLTFYCADLYRAEDGHFRVLRDYAANPSGSGYALENRIVMSRMFSELYHKSQTLRLAPFFRSFHQALIGRASLGQENPGIVLLSPGPESHLYFEHALLSRYLGYPLIESQDLTVRGGKVYLKKLAGLETVEAIFRHIDDLDSDPFALRRVTTNGIAGLIQVYRENNIEIVNPIGSGFVNTPALMPFLPSLCTNMLGRDLLLNNHPSWWCGNGDGYNHAINNLKQLLPGHAFDRSSLVSADPAAMIKADPMNYMVQDPIRPSAVPGWSRQGISSDYALLRVFVCATEEGFTVMPGGLAITAADVETLTANSPDKQRSKDVWVLSDGPVEPFSLMRDFHTVAEFKRSNDLPSRVADQLLWLGRYLERTEGLVRLLRLVFRKISGEDRPQDIPEMCFLLKLLRTKNIIAPPGKNEPEIPLFQELFLHLNNVLHQREDGESVGNLLLHVLKAARKVRDRLSLDSSRIINHLEDLADSSNGDPLEFLDEILFALSSFSGLAMESMTRSLGWRFMDMGRRVERAVNQAGLIHIALPLVCDEPRNTLETLLEISDSTMTYRARYRSAFQLAPVLDLLLVDESNPKSLAFQLSRIAGHIEHLPRQSERPFAFQEERIALKMLTGVRLLQLHEIKGKVEKGQNDQLHLFLSSISSDLKEFSQHITGHYLTRVQTTPHYTLITGADTK